MSRSVSVSILTNSVIAISKGIGWSITGSPTLFAETVHSLADVGNQVLLKIGEVRSRHGPDREHPFGRGQEKFFWALVSAVSVFFVGCGVNIYHGFHALTAAAVVAPFTGFVLGLLLVALALESWTFTIAWKEIGGWRGVADNRHDTTVIAVLLEDGVALVGILLTLLVAGIGLFFGSQPEIDAAVAIVVGVMLGVMALFLAAINRRVLIDTSDPELDRQAEAWLGERNIAASVHSLVLDNDRAVVFVHASDEVRESLAVGAALATYLAAALGKRAEAVYWQFRG